MKKLRRGMFLITTLMLIAFLVMLTTTLLVTTMGGMTSTTGYVNKKLADDAAVSGLNFVQAMLESNIQTLAPAPNGTAANTVIHSNDGTIQMTVQGWNVVGWVSNANSIGPGEQPLYMMFQACFNKDYSVFSANTNPPALNGIQLPACPFVSVNNLNRYAQGAANSSKSYTAGGTVHEVVQGQRADIIVIGYVVTPDGSVLTSRVVEGMYDVSQIGGFSGAAGMANTGINLIAGNTITVGANGTAPAGFVGLSSFTGNIAPQGTTAPVAGATAPPNYVSANKVALTAGGQFQYSQSGGGTTNYTASDAQMGAPKPPTVNPADLPPLQNQVTIPAGTYVVWGSPPAVYHYPTDYAATSGVPPATPTAIPVQDQNWAQPIASKPPTLNGVSPDAGPLSSLDSGGVIKLTPSPGPGGVAGNSFTLTANDVNVAPIAGVNSFTLVVAPTQTSANSANPGATIAGSDAANGSAQLQFQPAVSGTSLQLRAQGNVNIMGNVTGSGSVQATGTDDVSTLAANVNILGKSSLDTRSDSGIALYTNGETNVFGMTDANGNTVAQLPSSVGQYQAYLAANPQQVSNGGGGGGVANSPATAYVANVPIIEYFGGGGSTVLGHVSVRAYDSGGTTVYDVETSTSPATWATGLTLAQAKSQFAVSALNQVGSNQNPNTYVWSPGSGGEPDPLTALADLTQAVATNGASLSGSTDPDVVPPSGGGGVVGGLPPPTLDQVFNGLVYASGNFNFSTGANFTVNGALVANSGQINLSANNITLNYDSSLAGQFANLFAGGRVLLQRSSVTVY